MSFFFLKKASLEFVLILIRSQLHMGTIELNQILIFPPVLSLGVWTESDWQDGKECWWIEMNAVQMTEVHRHKPSS